MPYFQYAAMKRGYYRQVEENYYHPARRVMTTILNRWRGKGEPEYDHRKVWPLSDDKHSKLKGLKPNLSPEEFKMIEKKWA